jgi:hypothetical protein
MKKELIPIASDPVLAGFDPYGRFGTDSGRI